MKLGLKPPRPGAIKLRLATYLDFNKLPAPPNEFGHYQLVKDWQMLGNDEWGDCAEAGACHQTMLWTAEAGSPATFSTASALANYTAVAKFDPNAGPPEQNPTDDGTELGDLANYWVNTGIVDDAGKHHKIVATVDLNPGDLRELWVATYLFQSIGMGFDMPESAMEQARANQPWSVIKGAKVVGGHYVPAVGRTHGGDMGVGVSWGKTQLFTPQFYQKYNNQGICALSEDMLVKGASLDGFDEQLLRDDLKALHR